MATKSRIKPVLKGLSRSIACQRSAKCQRLDGHKGSHRQTLMSAPTRSAPVTVDTNGAVETPSADRYEVQPDGPKGRWVWVEDVAPVAKVPAKAPKARKASPRKVRTLREVQPKRRIGISGIVGQHRTARRAKAAPAGRRDVTLAEALAR